LLEKYREIQGSISVYKKEDEEQMRTYKSENGNELM